jgi:hypothetical protein
MLAPAHPPNHPSAHPPTCRRGVPLALDVRDCAPPLLQLVQGAGDVKQAAAVAVNHQLLQCGCGAVVGPTTTAVGLGCKVPQQQPAHTQQLQQRRRCRSARPSCQLLHSQARPTLNAEGSSKDSRSSSSGTQSTGRSLHTPHSTWQSQGTQAGAQAVGQGRPSGGRSNDSRAGGGGRWSVPPYPAKPTYMRSQASLTLPATPPQQPAYLIATSPRMPLSSSMRSATWLRRGISSRLNSNW